MLRPLIETEPYCTAVGLVAMQWSGLELSAHRVLWALARLDSRKGRCITQHMSLLAVWDAALALAREAPLSEDSIERLKDMKAQSDPLRVRRNEFVHAIWGITPETNLSLGLLTAVTAKARGQLNIAHTSHSVETMHEVARQISALGLRIAELAVEIGEVSAQ